MTTPPNIIMILADDMGYGDVRHLNPDCAFPTPHLDSLARDGMHCTDAHSSSAVCTPSRYSILTGRYCWRTWLKSRVLSGIDGPLIEPDRVTVASLLSQAGYRTACIGKWHLGWNWGTTSAHQQDPGLSPRYGEHLDWIDFHQPISNGPTTCGFDHFYGISGSLDMPPYVYVEDDRVEALPSAWAGPGEFVRPGPRQPGLHAHNVLGHLTDRAVQWIGQQDDQPFFLYFPLTAPHGPIAPAPQFMGLSDVSPYADFCMEVDHRVGQILETLRRCGQEDNTLVIFTSDNGASAKPAECAILEAHYGHHCSQRYRGYKSDIWDGGHRLPFLMRWPSAISAGSRCDTPIGLFDLIATCAELTGQQLPDDAGEDSNSFAPALFGRPIDTSRRPELIHHSIDGRFAIRQGRWKLCRCPGSGGWTLPDAQARQERLPPVQLYDMDDDPGEQRNHQDQQPAVVAELTAALHRIIMRGRSTPGPIVCNHGQPGSDRWPQVDWISEIPEPFIIDD